MSDTKTTTLNDVLSFIFAGASKEDRQAIGRALNSCRDDDILTARMEFKIGDKVKFEVRKRGYRYFVHGTVVKKNVKTIHVKPRDGGREWRVTASLLQKDESPAV